MNIYDFGSRVRLQATFTDLNDAAADPDAVDLQLLVQGKLSRATPTRDGAGLYHYDLDANIRGAWFYRFTGTGSLTAAAESSFQVRPSRFQGVT